MVASAFLKLNVGVVFRKQRYSSVRHPRLRKLTILIGCAVFVFARETAAQRTIQQANVDSMGRVRIVLSDKRVISPPQDSGQVGVEQLAVSTDRRIVGWLALYPNCCTTYPIPLELVLLRAGGGRTVIANASPIWQWAFTADGRSVVIRQAPVHGPAPMYLERRDIRTGRVTATATVDSSTRSVPVWARRAMPAQAPSPPQSY